MFTILVRELGNPDVLQYVEVPTPEPTPGTVRIKLAAIGINFIDTYQRSGQYKMNLPYTPGSEGAGIVDAVGEGETKFKVGDRVACASAPGSYAEYVIAPTEKVVPVPAGVELDVACAVLLQGMTAHYLAVSTFPLRGDHIALIHAAAGGTGQLLVQIAKLHRAKVIGTVSTEEKAQIAKQAGADEVILYTQQDFEAETKRITGGYGVDVVYDSVGKDTFDKSLNCLKPRGYMVLYGQSSGAVPPLDPQVLNAKGSLFLTRPTLANYTLSRKELVGRSEELFQWISEGKLSVTIDQKFALKDAAEAHRYLEGRNSKGKLLLIP